ncbi:hypothetical protein [Ignavibacterium sp.]|uniref:hypothetical protein n=1 Tax=Ignavibacterium sp. TaxID=2651167 RepID=UPI00307F8321
MKTIFIIITLITLNSVAFSQTISQEEKQEIINNLDSTKYWVREKAILDILQYEISEALPVLEQKIFTQERGIASLYLDGLFRFNSVLAVEYAHKFIDTVEYLPDIPGLVPETSDSYGMRFKKYKAAILLFEKNDFSRADIIISWIDFVKPQITAYMPLLLGQILNNVPQYEVTAKNELLRIANSSEAEEYSTRAVSYLVEYYDEQIIPELLNIYSNNNYYLTKRYVLGYLDNLNYFDYENFLKAHFNTDTTIADIILEKLLISYPTPATYVFITENYNAALSHWDQHYYASILQNYEPTPPKTLYTFLEYIDFTNSLCDTLQLYNWLGDLNFSNELKNILTTAKTNLQNGDSLACRVQVKAFQDLVDNVYKDSLNTDPRFVTIEGWKFLYWNAQYILDRLPEPPANPNLVVNLKNSLGNQIPASNVQYYEGSWKDAVNNGDGTFTVITTRPTVSIRVFYEYASLQADNVNAQNNTYTFTTVNAAVQLKNSLGNLIDQGTVQYYAGAWRSFGTTSNGVAYKELLPINYSFRMTYEFASIDKQQNLSSDPTVVFQTVNAAVQLKNSLGNLIDQGTVQYYAGAWRTFGTTSNGVATKELLPINYSFRMTYEYVSKDKQQNLSTNPVVDFNTVLCSVKVSSPLANGNNQPINNAAVKYYAGAWRNLGTTNIDGITTKELLPANLSFRATSGNVSVDKQQDISVNSFVEILLNVP